MSQATADTTFGPDNLPRDIGALSLTQRIDLIEQFGAIGANKLTDEQLSCALELMSSLRRESKPREKAAAAPSFTLNLDEFTTEASTTSS